MGSWTMKVPRFKLRSLLIAVAILAVVLGGGVLYQRRSYHLAKAELYRANEVSVRATLMANGPGTKDYDHYVYAAELFKSLRLKHERAASLFRAAGPDG